MEKSTQENIKLEQQEIDALLDRGMELEVGKEKFTIYRPFGGQLDLMSECFLNMEIDETEFSENPNLAAQKIVNKSMRWMARALAIMILGKKCAKIFKNPLTKSISVKINEKKIEQMTDYILWNMSSKDVMMFATRMPQITGVWDFIASIRYVLKMTKRTTKPNLIEDNKPA